MSAEDTLCTKQLYKQRITTTKPQEKTDLETVSSVDCEYNPEIMNLKSYLFSYLLNKKDSRIRT